VAKSALVEALVAKLLWSLFRRLAQRAASRILGPLDSPGQGPEIIAARVATESFDGDELRSAAAEVATHLGDEFAKGAADAARLTAGAVIRPRDAATWATAHAGELVKAIDGPTRDAVRLVTLQALRDGLPSREAAARIGRVVGLHPAWAKAVATYEANLRSGGMSADRATAKADEYADRLRRRRAENIARTELQRASYEGRLAAWRAAESSGAVAAPVKVWRTAKERVCPICKPLDGVRVHGLDAPFTSGRVVVLAPPAHPSCRCTIRLEVQHAQPSGAVA
jgi:hypothetical protein